MKKTILFLLFPFLSFAQWPQIGSDINSESIGDRFGTAVAMNAVGNIIAVGANLNDGNASNAGAVRIFQYISNAWTQIGNDIDGEAANDNSGLAISLNAAGTIIAIGAPENDDGGTNSGHVRVYQNNANVWMQIGSDIDGNSSGDAFGESVSLSADGTTLAIGASGVITNLGVVGQVKVYQNSSGVWTPIGNAINGIDEFGAFGSVVTLSSNGNILAVSAPAAIDGKGVTRIYQNISNVWTQIGSDIIGIEDNESSGQSISISANGARIAIGAPYVNSDSGQTRVYENQGGSWVPLGGFIDGNTIGGTYYHIAVTLSDDGNTLAIGGSSNIGSGTFGHYEGSVKVYQLIGTTWSQSGADIIGIEDGERFGASIDFNADASALIIGSPRGVVNGNHSGISRIFGAGTLSTQETNFSNKINVFQNQISGEITIQLDEHYPTININIVNILGQTVSSFKSNVTNKITFNLSGVAGLYFIQISNNEGEKAVFRVTK